MPIPSTTPTGLRPFEMHGLELRPTPAGEGIGDCPFCGAEDKFSANCETGEWRCFSCENRGYRGNAITFLRKLHEASLTGQNDYDELAADRRLLHAETLFKWGVCRSILTGEWIIPAYNAEGNICQLYRYIWDNYKKKNVLYATPKLVADENHIAHGLFGVPLFDKNKIDVHITEGPWDAMAEWELLGNKVNILATPGCNVFFEPWILPYFKSRRVAIIFDNDHPRDFLAGNATELGTGIAGTRRTAGILKGVPANQRPESIRFLRWGPDPYGHDPHLPNHYDLRDVISLPSPQNGDGIVPLGERDDRLRNLLGRLEPVPDAWPAVKLGSEELTCLPCTKWSDLLDAWEKAMHMTPGLRKALAVLMACALSTELIGEQLWVRLMGPPSSGKTTLCEAMTVAKKYVKAVSTFRGFHSGYKTDKGGEDDHSLIPHICGRTFIIKDGDTLLKAPNRELIMAEFRDIFDGTSRAHYRHGLNREYDNIRVTVVISGTSNLRELDASECGGRFIDCIVMERIDLNQEMGTMLFVIEKAWKNVDTQVNGKAEKRGDADKIKAKRLTGGYVNYLRERAAVLARAVNRDPAHMRTIADYGVFVAYMRARPSETQTEISEREFGGRLVEQYARLAVCLAAATGKTHLDKEVLGLVHQTALDTCRGRTLEISRFLYNKGEEGTPFTSILAARGGREDDLKEYMRFLRDIGVVEAFELKSSPLLTGQLRWRLTPYVRGLYQRVVKGTQTDIGG